MIVSIVQKKRVTKNKAARKRELQFTEKEQPAGDWIKHL